MNTKPLLFLDVDPQDHSRVRSYFPEAVIESEDLSDETLIDRYADTEVLCVSHHSTVSRYLIESLKHLKLVVTRSVGFNHIDLESARENDVKVCNVPDYGAHVIAEHVFAMLLSMVRHIREADEQVEHYNYSDRGFRGMAMKGKTLGIIGTGNIGEHVARIASMGFLMEVLAFDLRKDQDMALRNHFRFVDNINEIWEKSDIISLHVPLNKYTEHMINAKVIEAMKPGVILLNTSRGGIINTPDLVEGIKSGKVACAGLDVLEDEKNIEKYKELIDLPQVVTTPHIAYFADDSVQQMYQEAASSIQRFLEEKELLHEVSH